MKNKILAIMTLVCACFFETMAQEAGYRVAGTVVDRWNKPIQGAQITIKNNPYTSVSTDRDGKFVIDANDNDLLVIDAPDHSIKTVEAGREKPLTIVMGFADQTTNVGYETHQNIWESTASVSLVSNSQFSKRSANSIGNALYGFLPGLTALANTGSFAAQQPSFYLRGLQTLSDNSPVILVDGVEREIQYLTPDEVETVVVLKDAPAVALYGYKGINGVINIITKRGKYNTVEVNVTYDHSFNTLQRMPEFVDAYTYASAMNEALGYEGSPLKYSQDELNAYQSGQYPYYYPNVDWVGETFRNTGATDLYYINFRGGGQKFRYFTAVNLQNNSGYIKNPNFNEGYSTQMKYSKGNLRTNLDIELTPSTKLTANVFGSLLETLRPGDAADLWGMVYTVPAAAIPAKLEDGTWGGNSTWSGVSNPVAQSQGAAYTKGHARALYADMSLKQDLSGLLPGLGGAFQLAYDNISNISENHSKTYVYNAYTTTIGEDGTPEAKLNTPLGQNTTMGTGKESSFNREFNFYGDLFYDREIGVHSLFSQLRWSYEYRNSEGQNTSLFRQNLSFYTHYGYNSRYFADLTLTGSASNRLAPGRKWALSPVISAAWAISNEDFMKNNTLVDFLKLRASFGVINTDNIPGNGYWLQTYTSGGLYSFTESYTSLGEGSWSMGRLASYNSTHEKAYKYNIGLDATLFKSLDLTIDGWLQKRKDIWIDGSGMYSSVLGFDAPYVNAGEVNSWGVEAGSDYHYSAGALLLTAGANFSLAKSKIINQLEAPVQYPWLAETGHRLNQLRGLVAVGLFRDNDDIANSPQQSYGTVYPGDIKYKDLNGDNIIDNNDITSIGYSTSLPEICYSFHIGAEWNGLGFDAMFQGTQRYSAMLSLKSMYRPLLNSTSLSQYYYDNRWTPENADDAIFPRLASQSSQNNYRASTFWLRDRSFLKLRNVEVYYNLPKSLLRQTKVLNSAKLYLKGIDLLCFDHIKQMDPETYNSATPLPSSILLGLSIGF